MYRYFFSVLAVLLGIHCHAQQSDSAQHQLRLSVDARRPVENFLVDSRQGYEFAADYYFSDEVYACVEAGWGSSAIDYPDLQYQSNNAFVRIGVDRSMLKRLFPEDWDFIFVGVRYGLGFINRSEATYTTNDDFWGITTGTIPSKSFTAHWAELTGGLKVELFKGLFAGWNIRAKFLLNQKPFREFPPSFVAGYGRGEKNTAFDFNFYLGYAFRW